MQEAEKGRGLYDIHSEYRDVHKLLGALLGAHVLGGIWY